MKLLFWFVVYYTSVAYASAADFHVSPDGSDENPEWKKMRGMAVPPKETILPDGTVMRGHRIERNIFDYPRQPNSWYIRISNCNLEANIFDYSTVWNGDEEPIGTGMKGYKAVKADRTETIPNREFPAASDEVLQQDANQTAAKMR